MTPDLPSVFYDFRLLPAAEQARLAASLTAEWLEAHPTRMAHLYARPDLLHSWQIFAGGVLIGSHFFGKDGYAALEELAGRSEVEYLCNSLLADV